MKNSKFYLLLMAICFLVSCSKDDDSTDKIEQDPIIGSWETIKLINESGISSTSIDCDQRVIYTFSANNTFSASVHNIKESDSSCYINQTVAAEWKNTVNKYAFKIISMTDTDTQEVETTSDPAFLNLNISFSKDKATFTIINNDSSKVILSRKN
ncbi:MAG: hypothetical protein V3U92_12000 [Cellulophaga sp.]